MSTLKGQQGEAFASRYLQRHGYRIVARNVRIGPGEIDLIAEHHDVLVFIEVKSYRQREQGLLAVHRDKQHRIIRAATAWLARQPQYRNHYCRFDVLLIMPPKLWQLGKNVEHIEDAFRPA